MTLSDITVEALFDLAHTVAAPLGACRYPWEFLADIAHFLAQWQPTQGYRDLGGGRFVHEHADIAASARIEGPCIIGAGTQIRHCAFLRGNVIVGEGCVVGNSTELKNAVLFDGVQVPHFNYVGDSILGYKAHLGAGAVASNVRADRAEVVVSCGGARLATGRKKVGAMLGDRAEVGCNCVLNPGTVLGRDCIVYPLSCVRGAVPANAIYKSPTDIVLRR